MVLCRWSAAGVARPERLAQVFLALLVVALSACGGGDGDAGPTDLTSASVASTTTSMSTTSSSTTSVSDTTIASTSSSTTEASTTTTIATTTDPVAACESYVSEMTDLLLTAAEHLETGQAIAGEVADGTMAEANAVTPLQTVADELGALVDRFDELGAAPTVAVPLSDLVGGSLVLFRDAFVHQAEGASTGDAALIDKGAAELLEGETLLAGIAEAAPDCASAADPPSAPAELATPSELDLTVFSRVAETLMANGSYAGTPAEDLIPGAQASCEVLLSGGDTRAAIEAAVAASPADGQTFGADEQNLVLMMVSRGANLWCPSVVGDEEAFASDVRSTIVDIFFES